MDEDKARLKKKLRNSTTFIRKYSCVEYFVRKVYKQILQCQHQMMLSSTLRIIDFRSTSDGQVGRLSTDSRTIVNRYIGRQSTDKCVHIG